MQRTALPAADEFVTISTDITLRKRAEQLSAEKNKELEQIVYVASHDLRTPLVNIDGYGRELEQALVEIQAILAPQPPPAAERDHLLLVTFPEMLRALHHVRAGTRQMDALIKGLLNLSRSSRAALNIANLDMNALLAEVVSSFDHLARHAGARLTVDDLPPCRGDPVQLGRVFSNLISNALKFLDPQRPGIISIRGRVEKGRCLYEVVDNGLGIPATQLGRIFELFHRLDPARTEGEGLGLAIVRQIIGRLEGEVWVESEPGQGSRFCLSLPPPRPS